MRPETVKEKLQAAYALFSEGSTTIEKLRVVRPMLSGVNGRLDRALVEYDRQLGRVENLLEGDVFSLSAEELSETTDKEKKRKAAFLLLFKSVKQIEGEMERVSHELQKGDTRDASMWSKILGAAKGPLGIITLIAIAAALLHTTAVTITIQNDGCDTVIPSSSFPFPLPGFSLPKAPIASGEAADAVVPPLSVSIDGTKSGQLFLSSLGINLTFELGSAEAVTLDSISLIGEMTSVNLGDAPEHVLVLSCG